MVEVARNMDLCMQSDSVHRFVYDPKFAETNITFTSAYCPVKGGQVPLVIAIMLGKTQEHYKSHFLILLRSLSYASFDDFDARFPGMACDMSQAELNGFRLALMECYGIKDILHISKEKHYRFCTFHYKCSLECISKIGSVIHPDERVRFYQLGVDLLQNQPFSQFTIIYQQHLTEFPGSCGWLDWHFKDFE
ncbi:hypothetical protein BG000_000199 [Podila horticola]|nr:hypothetical protein BG000_000199 [Podila horticola]